MFNTKSIYELCLNPVTVLISWLKIHPFRLTAEVKYFPNPQLMKTACHAFSNPQDCSRLTKFSLIDWNKRTNRLKNSKLIQDSLQSLTVSPRKGGKED